MVVIILFARRPLRHGLDSLQHLPLLNSGPHSPIYPARGPHAEIPPKARSLRRGLRDYVMAGASNGADRRAITGSKVHRWSISTTRVFCHQARSFTKRF